MTPPNNFQEFDRLNALRSYELLDTPPDGAFDNVTELAADYFKVPICLISLVDKDRIWFKSSFGLGAREIPRSPGLCASAIYSPKAYVVKDAVKDPRTLSNPLVVGEMGLKFYAAAPLVSCDGFGLGTINIIDFAPREFNSEDEAKLLSFGALVMQQMDLRLTARKTIASLVSMLLHQSKAPELEKLVTVCAWTKKIKINDDWLSFDEFLVKTLGLTVTHGIHPEAMSTFRR